MAPNANRPTNIKTDTQVPYSFSPDLRGILYTSPKQRGITYGYHILFLCPAAFSWRMKIIILCVAFSSLAWAQEQPRYSCPEYDVDFNGNNLEVIEGVDSWEDCGKTYCLLCYPNNHGQSSSELKFASLNL